MEQAFVQLSHVRLWAEYANSKAGNVQVTAVYQHDKAEEKPTHSNVSTDDIAEWLKNEKNKTFDGKEFSCSTRFVWVRVDEVKATYDIQAAALNNIVDKFGLALAYRFYPSSFAGIFKLPSKGHVETYSLSYHPKIAVIWSYSATENITQVIVFASAKQIAALKNYLEYDWKLSKHRMFPAFLASFVLSGEIDQTHDRIKKQTREVEVRTGYHQFQSRHETAATAQLGELNARMSGFATKLAGTTRKMNVLEELNAFILEHANVKLSTSASANISSDPMAKFVGETQEDAAEILKTNMELLQRRLRMQVVDNSYILERVKVQISALFGIIQQKDTLISLSLARDSKVIASRSMHDSSAMKALAIVTVVFLPGTYVCSLFSMPLFDWSGEASVMRPKLKVYWAVALPLTCVVLIAYFAWNMWSTWSRKAQRSDIVHRFNQATGEGRKETEAEALEEKRVLNVGGNMAEHSPA